MGNFIKEQPVWFMGILEALVAAVLNLVLVFGFALTGEQIAAINGVVLVVLSLSLSLYSQKPVERLIEREAAARVARML